MNWDFLKDILPSLITLIVAIVSANFGLRIWRRQLIEKEKRDFAKEILKKLYEVTDIIKYIRSPMSGMDEGSTRRKYENESKEREQTLNQAYIPYERYYKYKDVFMGFRSLKYEFNIIFNKNDCYLFDEIERILNKILTSGFSLGRHYWGREGLQKTEEQLEKLYADIEKRENIIWDQGEGDEINLKLDEITEKFEDVCYKAIKKK